MSGRDAPEGECPRCHNRLGHTDAVTTARCELITAYRDALAKRAVQYGIPEPQVHDLFAHMRRVFDDGTAAHIATHKVLDLGWRPRP